MAIIINSSQLKGLQEAVIAASRRSGKSRTTYAYVHWAAEQASYELKHAAGDGCPICKAQEQVKGVSKFEAMGGA